MECVTCNKELFLSEMLAGNAAFLYNLIHGKEYDCYECPQRKGDFHLTTREWRRKKLAEASKLTACSQERP